MNTLIVLGLVTWTVTCLAIIHHRHLRHMASNVLWYLAQFYYPLPLSR